MNLFKSKCKTNFNNSNKRSETNQNETNANREQPIPGTSMNEFQISDDETFTNEYNINMQINSNESIRSNIDDNSVLSNDDLSENLNNPSQFSDEDSTFHLKSKKSLPKHILDKDSSFHFQSFNCKNYSNYKSNGKKRNSLHFLFNLISYLFLVIKTYASILGCMIKRKLKQWKADIKSQRSISSAFKRLFTRIIDGLFCFCNLNICRSFKMHGFLAICGKSKKSSCEESEDDEVITKCSWPVLAAGTLILFIFVAGCLYSHSEDTWIDKYQIGVQKMKDVFNAILNDIKNMAGLECLYRNRCCHSKMGLLMRWINCVIKQPYYIATLSPQIMRKKKIGILDENMIGIDDWRLKRQIKRMAVLLKNIKTPIALMDMKTSALLKSIYEANSLFYKNFTIVDQLEIMSDKLDNNFEEMSKDLDKLQSNIAIITAVNDKLKKSSTEIRSCIKCSTKTLIDEIDTLLSTHNKDSTRLIKKMTKIKSVIHSKLKIDDFDKEANVLKRAISRLNDENLKFQRDTSKLESISYQISGDMNTILTNVKDRMEIQVSHSAITNQQTINRFQKLVNSVTTKMANYRKENEVYFKNLIYQKYNDMVKPMISVLMRHFSENLGNHVKESVTLALRSGSVQVQKCSMFVLVNHEKEIISTLNIDLINEAQIHSFCNDKTCLQSRILESLNKYQAEQTGILDYALSSNGAEIVEDSTLQNIWNWNILYSTSRYLLQSNIIFDQCWKLKSMPNFVTIQIGYKINVSRIGLAHISKSLTFSNSVADAPKEFEIYNLQSLDDKSPRLIGVYEYDINGPSVQTFDIKITIITSLIRLKIHSNHGDNSQTCVYKLKIYGNVVS